VMVALLIVWCTYTVWVRGAHLPPFPWPSNIQLDKEIPRMALRAAQIVKK